MSLNTEKLTQFAQAVGADVKEIKTTLATKADKSEIGQGGITQQFKVSKRQSLVKASPKNSTRSKKSPKKSKLAEAQIARLCQK